MGSAPAKDNAPDQRSAAAAGLPFTAVDLMQILKGAAAAFGIDIARYRGAFSRNGGLKNIDHGAVKPPSPLRAEPGGDRARVNRGLKQGFVGVDIAHTAKKALIEKERLDPRAPAAHQIEEIGFVDIERVGTEPGDTRGEFRRPLDSTELAGIVVEQQAFVKFEDGAGVGAWRGIEQQSAGHSKVNDEIATVELHHDKFAVASNAMDFLSGHT